MTMRAVIGALIVVAAGVGALAWASDGFRVVTAEGARRLTVAEKPRRLPDLILEDQDGRRFRLADYRGRRVAVEFFYGRCPTVCGTLTQTFQRLDEALARDGQAGPAIVSISFDPAHDTPERLADYGRAFGADGRRWRFARPADAAALAGLLAAAGVVVIADTAGGFVHNAAIHVLDQEGRLARIYDLENADAAAAMLRGGS